MKLMMLYGVNCTIDIWNNVSPYLKKHEIDYVEYPHEITQYATKVDDITEWVYENYGHNRYDAVIGHSLGGLIALQLVAKYKMKAGKIVYLDTSLKPASEFYKNLMTPKNMELYGKNIVEMLNKERKFYTDELLRSIQDDFDYTDVVYKVPQEIYAVYGDRGMPEYSDKIKDLNLPAKILKRLNLIFIQNSCHMIMIENPKGFLEVINEIL